MYEACAEAVLKGSKINEIYSNGEEFCESRRYNINKKNKEECFFYKIVPDSINFSASNKLSLVSYLGTLAFIKFFI